MSDRRAYIYVLRGGVLFYVDVTAGGTFGLGWAGCLIYRDDRQGD